MQVYEKLVKQLQYCATHDCTHEGEIEVGCTAPYEHRDGITTCNDVLMLQAADAIENTSKAYQMMAEAYESEAAKPRWIPVTERFPNEKQAENVLCWIMDGDPKAEGYCVSGCYNTLAKSWRLDADWVDPWKITHWMPSPQGPEPPKEEV